MDQNLMAYERCKIVEASIRSSEDYRLKLVNKNCEVLKKLNLMSGSWNENKKHEMSKCRHCLKKWEAGSAMYTLEAFTKTFVDVIDLMEKQTFIRSETDKSNIITTESTTLGNTMEKGMLYNKKILSNMKNAHGDILTKNEGKKDTINNFYISKKGSLAFERINVLLKKSEELKYEMNKHLHEKKQMEEKFIASVINVSKPLISEDEV